MVGQYASTRWPSWTMHVWPNWTIVYSACRQLYYAIYTQHNKNFPTWIFRGYACLSDAIRCIICIVCGSCRVTIVIPRLSTLWACNLRYSSYEIYINLYHLTVCTECMIRVLFVGSLAPFLVLLILMSFRAMAGTLDPFRRSEEKRKCSSIT
jgi:hypothetical protein